MPANAPSHPATAQSLASHRASNDQTQADRAQPPHAAAKPAKPAKHHGWQRLPLPLRRWVDAEAAAENIDLTGPRRPDWLRVLPFAVMHLGCLGVFFVAFNLWVVAAAVGLYLIRMFAITAFYHRYFSHRAFKTSRWFQSAMALVGLTAIQRGPLWWAAHHRHHHLHSDTEADEHSPAHLGFWWAHMGWFTAEKNFPTRYEKVRDFAKFPELRFMDRFDSLFYLAFGVLVFAFGSLLGRLVPSMETNGWQWLFWCFFLSTVCVYHATYTINSLSHKYGSQRFDTGDDSRNNFWLALLTLGEGWHNNHHHYPVSVRQGFYWWELDVSYLCLLLLNKLGLIWELNPVTEKAMQSKRLDPASNHTGAPMAEDQAKTNSSKTPHKRDPQRIAIVGGGVSGLVCAHLLGPHHDVTLYEARERLGGHTHTHALLINDQPLNVDTGFIVYNPRNYPLFCKLLENLGVEGQDTAMSFSVEDGKTGLIYNGTDLNGLFAQRKNLISPRFWGLLKDMWRFNQDAKNLANASPGEASQTEPDDEPLHAFLARKQYGDAMVDKYLLPMGSAIWSTDIERFKQFPAKFLAEFLNNHGMLDLVNRPVWRTVVGGSNTYVKALVDQTPATFLTNHPVQTVRRLPDGIECLVNHQAERFDHIIFACHSNQTLAILADPTADEDRALSGVPYQPNQAVLHTDLRCMPPIRRAWAAWNYHLPSTPSPRATLTYNMNILQKLPIDTQIMVTLNPMPGQIDPEHVLQTIEYQHPLYTTERAESHRLWNTINHQHHTSFCGAYWGHGFHEDGVRSAVKVCERFGVSL